MDEKQVKMSRRKLLASASVVGAAGVGAGLGTSALFSDEESFVNNAIEAGELDLIVDYDTSVDQDGVDTGSTTGGPGQINGNPASGEYVIRDLKPGDSGQLEFCPKIVDNPGWLWVGSVDGLSGAENGQTEPETGVDATGGDPGDGRGELAEAIQVTVSYVDASAGAQRELNNPDDYTLGDLFADLESGFLIDGEPFEGDPDGRQPYPNSPNEDTQSGPCLLVEWEVPTAVGNWIQSDSVAFDVTFAAVQSRNNPSPENPFVDVTVGPGGGDDFDSIQAAIDDSGTTPGDVVTVAPGTYDEAVTVDTAGLHLAAPAGPSQTTITDQVVVSADDVTLLGFTVSPPPATTNAGGEAIRVSNAPDGAEVRNNVVEDFDGDGLPEWEGIGGIVAYGGDDSDPIENVSIVNNTVRRIQGRDTEGGAAGISLQGNVDGATVQRNSASEIGRQDTSWAFGVTVRAAEIHNQVPRNVNVVDNEVSEVLANTTTDHLGVGLGIEADGTDYVVRGNAVEDVELGVDLKAAADELALLDNGFASVQNAGRSHPKLYFGDRTGNANLASIMANNTYDVAVESGPVVPPYVGTIVPA